MQITLVLFKAFVTGFAFKHLPSNSCSLDVQFFLTQLKTSKCKYIIRNTFRSYCTYFIHVFLINSSFWGVKVCIPTITVISSIIGNKIVITNGNYCGSITNRLHSLKNFAICRTAMWSTCLVWTETAKWEGFAESMRIMKCLWFATNLSYSGRLTLPLLNDV